MQAAKTKGKWRYASSKARVGVANFFWITDGQTDMARSTGIDPDPEYLYFVGSETLPSN